MEKLSEAEMALIFKWCEIIRTKTELSVRPTLMHYLMTEILIDYLQQLPDGVRPGSPTERVLGSIGTDSGTLSRRRTKWQKTWNNLKKMIASRTNPAKCIFN